MLSCGLIGFVKHFMTRLVGIRYVDLRYVSVCYVENFKLRQDKLGYAALHYVWIGYDGDFMLCCDMCGLSFVMLSIMSKKLKRKEI